MRQFNISGMSCAACSARVEKAVSKLDGITSCSVSLLTNSMGVEGTAEDKDIIAAVKNAGYGASKKGVAEKESNDTFEDKETPVLKKRLIYSLAFLAVLMYFSMGHTMWGWPLPDFLAQNHVALALVQHILTVIIMVINQKFFISGFTALVNKAPNMDTLVALGSGAAFVYSTYALFMMTDAQLSGDMQRAMQYMHELYFESAAMILALITLGKMLEAHSKGKTTNALKSLINLAPKTAVIIENGEEKEINVSHIKKGDIFVVRQGAAIPADGIVLEGHCAVNESALTGESIPVEKEKGDSVSAATINQSGYIRCEATKVGEDTALSQIIRMVSEASATKAPIAKAADKVSGVFVPIVIGIAMITVVAWLICGQSIGFALARGISVLVISCPCALGLATPVAIMVGNGLGAKNGILFKNAVSLEICGKVNIIALDKTGTITKGQPEVTDVLPANKIQSDFLLNLAYSLEEKSEHPLAKAIVKKAQQENLTLVPSESFKAYPGGVSAFVDGASIFGGNYRFISSVATLPESAHKSAENLALEGKTPLFFVRDGEFIGIIAVSDAVKQDSPKAINELKNMGIKVVMLTGDNERTADAVKKAVGVDEVVAGVLPDGKENVIKSLKHHGKVAMVGDGINDAPALTAADVGIAIGAGTDVAIDAADVVLMNSRLSDVSAAIRLSRATLRNIHQNLFWAFIYNVIGIPLAAGVWIELLGWQLNPMFGAAAMSLSSFCVVTNALRLNLFDIKNTSKDRKRIIRKKENTMEKTLKIEGMMCAHCEARVKKCLEEIDGVSQAIVSHENGTAIVKLEKDVPYETLKKIVTDQGYTVLE